MISPAPYDLEFFIPSCSNETGGSLRSRAHTSTASPPPWDRQPVFVVCLPKKGDGSRPSFSAWESENGFPTFNPYFPFQGE
jgi:hypothetical protein